MGVVLADSAEHRADSLVSRWPLRNSGVDSVAQRGRAACRPDTQPHTGVCSFLVSVSVCPGPGFFLSFFFFKYLFIYLAAQVLIEACELLVAAGGI